MAETGKIVAMTSARERGSERNWRRWITPYKFGRDRGNLRLQEKICSLPFRNHVSRFMLHDSRIVVSERETRQNFCITQKLKRVNKSAIKQTPRKFFTIKEDQK